MIPLRYGKWLRNGDLLGRMLCDRVSRRPQITSISRVFRNVLGHALFNVIVFQRYIATVSIVRCLNHLVGLVLVVNTLLFIVIFID